MERCLVLLVFMLASAVAYSQNNDNAYLNTVAYGVSAEQIPDDNSFAFMRDENDDMAMKQIEDVNDKPVVREIIELGYKGLIEVGSQIGVGDWGVNRLKLNILNGYQIDPFFTLSFGTGARYEGGVDITMIPVFADLRVKIFGDKISTYGYFGMGYSFDASNDFEGVGVLISPGIGISLKASDNTAMNLGLGYEIQRMKFTDYYVGAKRTIEIMNNSGAVSITIGVSF